MSVAAEAARQALAQAAAGRLEEALRSIDRAIAADPQPAFWLARGEFLVDLGRAGEAAAAFEAADRARPGHAPTLSNLAFARLAAGDARGAQSAAESALAVDPRHALARANLGRALQRQGAFTRAERELALAAAGSRDPALHLALANTRLNLGLAREALAAFDAALALSPRDADQVASARLVALHYDDHRGADELFEAHRDWAARFAPAPPPRPPRAAPPADGRLRIGYVSPRLHGSTAGALLAPVLDHHDRERFAVYAYACSPIEDELTARMRSRVDAWRRVDRLDDLALARQLREDGIVVAVDLAGHTPGHRLGAFARRAAPVQVTWLDYFDTTGLEAMDAIVADAAHVPHGDAHRFTERVVRLPGLRYCWEAPAGSPPVPDRGPGRAMTFGSFNRIAKLSGTTLRAWAEVLRAVPEARLVVKSPALEHAEEREALLRRFEREGVDPARVEPRPASPYLEMLAQYGDVDVALDSFPYNGGITTLEALWMGCPVLTIRGASMIARQSAAILDAVGLEHWIARDTRDFVSRAVAAAADRDRLRAERASLRGRLLASPAMDARGFTRGLENAFAALAAELS